MPVAVVFVLAGALLLSEAVVGAIEVVVGVGAEVVVVDVVDVVTEVVEVAGADTEAAGMGVVAGVDETVFVAVFSVVPAAGLAGSLVVFAVVVDGDTAGLVVVVALVVVLVSVVAVEALDFVMLAVS